MKNFSLFRSIVLLLVIQSCLFLSFKLMFYLFLITYKTEYASLLFVFVRF
ncbi:unnamed protein product [Psylliodes chrysocephalus]|uniref:Uncharacterized protein n=1 Tax=Psylliodes chrysocephalus TaxID=3402493 RepID=A0A9P0G8D3_9CUCU|nr:unnamed protein product [Psylliodes chrysocephala]